MLIGEWVTTGKEFTRNERSEKKTVGKSKDNFNEKIKKKFKYESYKEWLLGFVVVVCFLFCFFKHLVSLELCVCL